MPSAQKKKKRLTASEGEWFRQELLKKLDECNELRKLIESFANDLDHGLAGHLLAEDLRARIRRVPKR